MTTKREQIFQALFTVLGDVANVRLRRNEVLPERLDDGSDPLVIQQDGGDAPDAEITLSPPVYAYDETVNLEIAVQQGTDREEAIDDILATIGAALSIDRTLGGLADDVRVTKTPHIEDRVVAGAAPLKVATVAINVQYTTTDPLA